MFNSKMLSLFCCLICSIAFTYAQPTSTARFVNPDTDNNSVVIRSGGNTYHFNKLALKAGKNVKKLDRNISIEMVKSRTGKIVSIKTRTGNSRVWGPDLLAAPDNGSQEFKCNPHVCICSGVADCIDMAFHMCKEDTVACTNNSASHCACAREH